MNIKGVMFSSGKCGETMLAERTKTMQPIVQSKKAPAPRALRKTTLNRLFVAFDKTEKLFSRTNPHFLIDVARMCINRALRNNERFGDEACRMATC